MSAVEEAHKALERAEVIGNHDNWHGDRGADVARQIAVAQVHATLAVAEAIKNGITTTTYTLEP
jgi:hypothetical protein